MKYLKLVIVAAAVAFASGSAVAQGYTPSPQDAPHVKPVTAYAIANIRPFLSDPIVVNAVEAQNKANANLKSHEINKLDNAWMDRFDKELIELKINNELSTFLRKKKEAGNGVIFEIFVVDNKGLNVGETDLTQDSSTKVMRPNSGRAMAWDRTPYGSTKWAWMAGKMYRRSV